MANKTAEIVIIGAGACGLMAARELCRAGKKVIVLEARDRIGGRIFPLPEKEFGYPAQGGGEFVHGSGRVTKALLAEAGLHYVGMSEEDETWTKRDRKGLEKNSFSSTDTPEFARHRKLMNEKLKELKKDMPIASFLEKYFKSDEYARLRGWVTGMVQGFDAADPNTVSTFSLREEWLGKGEWEQGRVKEGYTAMLAFLESECRTHGGEIFLNEKVQSVEIRSGRVHVQCAGGDECEAEKAMVTVPLPLIEQIKFNPAIPKKVQAAKSIGFGPVIKLLIRFKDRWWVDASGKDLSRLSFLLADGDFGAWWTQYPDPQPTLTGWIAGPRAKEFSGKSEEELIAMGFASLEKIFGVDKEKLKKDALACRAINWLADPFARGAYSFSTVGAEEAYAELRKPVDNKIFFAGEALYHELETATVEGALGSGKEVAEKILRGA